MRHTVRSLSEVNSHPDNRWDGEYLCFEPVKGRTLKYVPIGSVVNFSQYGASIAMNEDAVGTKIYRMNEIKNMFCNRSVLKYAQLSASDVSLYRLHDRDVLFNRTNSQHYVGRTGIFRAFSSDDMVFASYLVRIRTNTDIVTPEYLTAFLNTKYGVVDVKRRARISINQSNVNPEELKRVEIPLICHELQAAITSSFDQAFDLLRMSELEYCQAQRIILDELGLVAWQPGHKLTFLGNHSATLSAGRMDAEYFHPSFRDMLDVITEYPGGCVSLGHLVEVKHHNFEPKDGTEYKYIELSDIGSDGEIVDCTVAEGQELPSRARRKVTSGDVIVSSVEGSSDRIAMVDEEHGGALCSTGFHVLNSNGINSETLLVLMKSIVGQLQLKRGCSGTILTAISKDELCRLVLPVIGSHEQVLVRRRITEATRLRQEALRLLDRARRSVEVAIEQGEKRSIEWLKDR